MKKRNVKYWFKNEKELMCSLGLKGTPGSGNGIIKEDGQNEYIIAQLKSTDKSQITIKLVDVNSLFFNASVTNKLPIFINQFINGPILVSMKLEDIPMVAKYLKTGSVESRDNNIIIECENDDRGDQIKCGNRQKVMNQLKKEREKKYKNRRR